MPFGGENADSYYDDGLTALMKGDVRRAVELLKHAIRLQRSMVAAHHQLARCYLRLGEYQRAGDILSQIVSNKPRMLPARLDYGQVLLSLGQIDRAREQFVYVLEAQESNGRAHMGMAQACFAEGNWEGAVSLAQGARAHMGANFAVLYLLGRAAKLAGSNMMAEEALQEAAGLIEKSLEMSPESPEGHYLRGMVCFAQERYASALDHFRAAEDRAEPDGHYTAFGENFTRIDIMVKQGLCLQRLGGIDAAREIGQRVVALDPSHKLGKALSELPPA
ncbi:MAG: tetratricopeptide repeat protein [Nitrospiraceae bacterium]|nr:tetratricopeptide repeat protein [Nitrospiraceae bacterium]